MKGTLIVIDAQSAPHQLLKLLASHGYTCHYARGPLKLRDILAHQRVHLILWRDAGGSPDLAEDLFTECAKYPGIPIIHLFGKSTAPDSLPIALNIVDSIPSASPGPKLLQLLTQILGSANTTDSNPKIAHTELAFRNLVSRLHSRFRTGAIENKPQKGPGNFHAHSTALNTAEREQLNHHRPEITQPGWWKRLWST